MLNFKLKSIVYLLVILLSIAGVSTALAKSQKHTPSPLAKPNMTRVQIRVWANEAAVSTYSYDFLNYQKQLENASDYFSPKAWKVFMQALNKSHNLDAIRKNKMAVSAVAQGAVVIKNQKVKNGVYSWQVTLPLLVTYANQRQTVNQPLTLDMLIERMPPYIGTRGVAITQFLTHPRVIKQKKPPASPAAAKAS